MVEEQKLGNMALDMGLSPEICERLCKEFEDIRDNSQTLGELLKNYTRNMNLMEKELIVKGFILRNYIVDVMKVDL